jgi:hypothetical protein
MLDRSNDDITDKLEPYQRPYVREIRDTGRRDKTNWIKPTLSNRFGRLPTGLIGQTINLGLQSCHRVLAGLVQT